MSNITVARSIAVPAPFDLKALLPDPQTLAFDAAGFNLQSEFMTEVMVRNVPRNFDVVRAGRHLRECLGMDYMERLHFAMRPMKMAEIPLVPLVVVFNRPMAVVDIVENLTKVAIEETRLCGNDPDTCIRQLNHSHNDLFGKLQAAGKLRAPKGP